MKSVLWRVACLALTLGTEVALACGPYEVTFYEFGAFYYKDESGKYVGIDPDVLAEVARRSHCTFNSRLDSRVRTWAGMADGSLDMTMSGIQTAERDVFARFVPYTNSHNYLIVRNELGERIKSLRAFAADKSLRLAVVRSFRHGATLDKWIDELRAENRVDEYADAEVVARLFAMGRADGFLSQPVTWGPLLRRNSLEDKVRKLDVAPQDSAIGGLVLSKKRVSEADADAMRSAIAAMRADGSLAAILARYVGADLAKEIARAP